MNGSSITVKTRHPRATAICTIQIQSYSSVLYSFLLVAKYYSVLANTITNIQQWIRCSNNRLENICLEWNPWNNLTLFFSVPQGFLYCFLRIICTSNCCETVSQTPIRKQMPRQKKDNFFKGVKRKWMADTEKNYPIVAIHRDYDNYYNREFVTVRKKPSIESLSVSQLVEETTNTKKSNDHANAILLNWTTTERI